MDGYGLACVLLGVAAVLLALAGLACGLGYLARCLPAPITAARRYRVAVGRLHAGDTAAAEETQGVGT